MLKVLWVPLLLVVLIISACAPLASTVEPITEKPTEEMMQNTAEPVSEVSAETEEMSTQETPMWFDIALTDINTDETFMISDFAGKVVLIENLAMWCPTCLMQQAQVKVLKEKLGEDSGLVLIGMDVDLHEVASDIKEYTQNNGFDWVYAIAPNELTIEIGNLYGAQFLNPPVTPMLIVDRKGVVHPLPFGLKSAEELEEFVNPFLAEGM